VSCSFSPPTNQNAPACLVWPQLAGVLPVLGLLCSVEKDEMGELPVVVVAVVLVLSCLLTFSGSLGGVWGTWCGYSCEGCEYAVAGLLAGGSFGAGHGSMVRKFGNCRRIALDFFRFYSVCPYVGATDHCSRNSMYEVCRKDSAVFKSRKFVPLSVEYSASHYFMRSYLSSVFLELLLCHRMICYNKYAT
jgi:hypothetical protein